MTSKTQHKMSSAGADQATAGADEAVAELAEVLGYDPETDQWAESPRDWLIHYLAEGLHQLPAVAASPSQRSYQGERHAEALIEVVRDLERRLTNAEARGAEYRAAIGALNDMAGNLTAEAHEAHDDEHRRSLGIHAGLGYLHASCETAKQFPAEVAARDRELFRQTVRLEGIAA